MKETRIQPFDQNGINQLNFILIFIQAVLVVVLIVLKLNNINGKHLNNWD